VGTCVLGGVLWYQRLTTHFSDALLLFCALQNVMYYLQTRMPISSNTPALDTRSWVCADASVEPFSHFAQTEHIIYANAFPFHKFHHFRRNVTANLGCCSHGPIPHTTVARLRSDPSESGTAHCMMVSFRVAVASTAIGFSWHTYIACSPDRVQTIMPDRRPLRVRSLCNGYPLRNFVGGGNLTYFGPL
jgi:hypothetical protein